MQLSNQIMLSKGSLALEMQAIKEKSKD